MSEREVSALLASGAIERVEPDPVAARRELAVARQHVESAASIADSDATAAFAIGYDAIRKAISAHMRARGYRVAKGAGHHRRVGGYANAALDDEAAREHLAAFDELRQLRNQSQYDGIAVERAEVDELLVHARAIVAAVGQDLGL